MTCLKRFSIALAFCFAASVPSWGQSAPVVYVAAGDSQVYAVSTAGAVNPLIPSSDVNFSAQFTSLTVGPDNTADNASGNTSFFLYACDTAASTIVRLRLSTANPGAQPSAADVITVYTNVSPLSAPVCGRVASNGDLYVSSGTSGAGVYVISGVSTASSGSFSAPAPVFDSSAGASFTGGGIAQKNSGDMLVVDKADGSILRAPFVGAIPPNPPNSPFGSTLQPYVSNLSSPSAIARISTGDFFVANQGAASVLKFNPANLSHPTTCNASLPNGNVTLSSVAASEDNFVYVGIASTSPNKRVVRVLNGKASDCGTVTSISLSGLSATSVAAVAVPPVDASPVSTDSNTDASGITASTFNFGSSAVQTLTQGCTPTVTQGLMPISYLQGLVSVASPDSAYTGTWAGGVPVPYNGEAGFGTVYTVSSSCQPADVYSNVIIGALTDNTQFTNPRIIRCDGSSATNNQTCTVTEASGTWPVGGLIQDDQTIGGKVPGFSRFFLANANFSGSSELATFCGFGSPLTTTSDPTMAAIFNSGQNLSVKFKLGAAATANSCSNGPYITDAQALLSVARVADGRGNAVFQPIAINSSGNSTSNPPTFSYNPNNQQYQFSMSLKNYAPGTYSLTVTFLTNNAPYVTTFFKVQ
jgi:hypothetical protein